MRFGTQLLGDLDAAAQREWLVADGCGGYAMGTAAGLRTRRYHGLLVASVGPLAVRRLGLAALDPILRLGDRTVRLSVHEWEGGVVDPRGHERLETFDCADGVPRWRWTVGDVCLEREVAMVRGRPAVAVVHRLLRAPSPVRLELAALVTWRDHHGQRRGEGGGTPPAVACSTQGFVFEGRVRALGPGFAAAGTWFRGVRYREEAARGLADAEDLWHAGTFAAELAPGATLEVLAWVRPEDPAPPPAATVVLAARGRARAVAAAAQATAACDRRLAHAADQLIVAGPRVVAGYPWFGEWSRDTMVSYEGLFLATRRHEEGRRVLLAAAATLSEGMLANTTDPVGIGADPADPVATAYNAADATLWFVNAVGRHLARTGDRDTAGLLAGPLQAVIDHHLAGTRFGIGVDPVDGLLRQGAPGLALTWMDARVAGEAVTARRGKAVELNALWVNALDTVAEVQAAVGRADGRLRARAAATRRAFRAAFIGPDGCRDVVGGDPRDAARVRPNSLFAVSLPHPPLAADDPAAAAIVSRAGAALLTPLGLRSLAPGDPAYRGEHRGGPAARDRAYHQGSVWPWLIGPYLDAALRVGAPVQGLLRGLDRHVAEWGLGSVSESADGDPPHRATGCPFQAWSVAELLRARRLLELTDRGPAAYPHPT